MPFVIASAGSCSASYNNLNVAVSSTYVSWLSYHRHGRHGPRC